MSATAIPHPFPVGYTTQLVGGDTVYACAVEACGFRIQDASAAVVAKAARSHRTAHKDAWKLIEDDVLALAKGDDL